MVATTSCYVLLVLGGLLLSSRAILDSLLRGVRLFQLHRSTWGKYAVLNVPLIFVIVFIVSSGNKRNRDNPLVFLFTEHNNFLELQGETITSPGNQNVAARNGYPTYAGFEKNVVLMICDALRADHMSSYGYYRNTTPFLEALVSQGNALQLTNFYATSSRPVLGISNILSSQYSLSLGNFFIHDLLKKQGYAINFILSGDHTNFYGLKDYYGGNVDMYADGYSLRRSGSAVSVNDDALISTTLKELDDYDGTPAFFYLHFMSAHQAALVSQEHVAFEPHSRRQSAPALEMINSYDNGLIQLDRHIHNTIQVLEEKGFLDDALIVITADHGQSLKKMNQDLFWHNRTTFMSEIRIPLVIVDTANDLFDTIELPLFANQLDIAPTLIQRLGLPVPGSWRGESILHRSRQDIAFQQEGEFYSAIFSIDDVILN